MRVFLLIERNDMAGDFKAVSRVLRHPPHSWDKYADDPKKHSKIIAMEAQELKECMEEGDYHCYVENLIHVAAACLSAHHAMTCDK